MQQGRKRAAAAPDSLRDFVAPVLERTEESVKVVKEEIKLRRAQVEASLNEDQIYLKTQAKMNVEKVGLQRSEKGGMDGWMDGGREGAYRSKSQA
jgi:hypothetical protein